MKLTDFVLASVSFVVVQTNLVLAAGSDGWRPADPNPRIRRGAGRPDCGCDHYHRHRPLPCLWRHVRWLPAADRDRFGLSIAFDGHVFFGLLLLWRRRPDRFEDLSMTGHTHLPGFEVPLYRALTEPILLGGAPRTIAIINGTPAAALGLGLRLWVVGLIVWIVGHAIAATAARRDAQFADVISRRCVPSGEFLLMLNLTEYRKRRKLLSDYLPWGFWWNRGSYWTRMAASCDWRIIAVPIWKVRWKWSSLLSLPGSTTCSNVLVRVGHCSLRRGGSRPQTIPCPISPIRSRYWWTKSGAKVLW